MLTPEFDLGASREILQGFLAIEPVSWSSGWCCDYCFPAFLVPSSVMVLYATGLAGMHGIRFYKKDPLTCGLSTHTVGDGGTEKLLFREQHYDIHTYPSALPKSGSISDIYYSTSTSSLSNPSNKIRPSPIIHQPIHPP